MQLEKPVKYDEAGKFVPSNKNSMGMQHDPMTFHPSTSLPMFRKPTTGDKHFSTSSFRSYRNARTQDSLEALMDAFKVKGALQSSSEGGNVRWKMSCILKTALESG